MKIYWNGTSKNIIGPKVKQLRTAQGLSQAALASRLQLLGMECSDLTILRIEKAAASSRTMRWRSSPNILTYPQTSCLGKGSRDNEECPAGSLFLTS